MRGAVLIAEHIPTISTSLKFRLFAVGAGKSSANMITMGGYKKGKEMPGPVSQSNPGPSDDSPYVPSWLYKNGPKMCPCGHHEGYHGDNGGCNQWRECGCTGIPMDLLTPFEEME